MDWFKQNPFTGGVLVVTALLVLAAGYFAMGAQTQLAEQQADFDNKVQQLTALRGNKPYPNAANVAAAEAELKKAQAMVAALDETVRQRSAALASVTPQAFQDDLRAKVNEITKLAKERDTEIADGFYLGFEQYETQPPDPAAAPMLSQQLASINGVIRALLDARVQSIGPVQRDPLPVEKAGGAAKPDAKKAGGSGLELAPFSISFTSEQSAAREALNGIVSAKPIVLVRLINVTNSRLDAPAKTADSPAGTSPLATEVAAAEPAAIPPVLGRETLTVAMRLASISTSGEKPKP